MNIPLGITDIENAPDLVVTHGKIEFHNVWFRYKRKWILQNFNLTISAGERVGLVGASGAGKTTLVNLLMRFYDVSRGEILIDGQDIRTVSQDSLRRSIAFIPQEPTMFNRTIGENIGYGLVGATEQEIKSASRRAAAHDFIMATEKKYDSLVGDRGIKLSGGQRQRIAIARAFLKMHQFLFWMKPHLHWTARLRSQFRILLMNWPVAARQSQSRTDYQHCVIWIKLLF